MLQAMLCSTFRDLVLTPLLFGLAAGLTFSAPAQAPNTPAPAASATPVSSLKVAKDFKVELLHAVPTAGRSATATSTPGWQARMASCSMA